MDTSCRCRRTPVPPRDPEDEDGLGGAEDQGDPNLPTFGPVPAGWHPDPGQTTVWSAPAAQRPRTTS
jgi:hypothetical protein